MGIEDIKAAKRRERDKFERMEAEANAGDPKSQYNLGEWYHQKNRHQRDREDALFWTTKAAEAGYADAAFRLGEWFHYGDGVEKNQEKSKIWYKLAVARYLEAAEEGDFEAIESLVECYRYGYGVECDLDKAVLWRMKAAEAGYALSQLYLAGWYRYGIGVPKDLDKAHYWLSKSAEAGDDLAQEELGAWYLYGLVEDRDSKYKDVEKAAYWYGKVQENGGTKPCGDYGSDRMNLLSLGDCCVMGEKKDWKKAAYWYTIAAKRGELHAMWVLRNWYLEGVDDGEENGIHRNLEMVKYWEKMMWDRTNGYIFQTLENKSERGERDILDTIDELLVAWKLGVSYSDGEAWAIERWSDIAIYWYTVAAEGGFVEAQEALADCYEKGYGVMKDAEKAEYWGKLAKEGVVKK